MQALLEYIGGKENIRAVSHCMTRIRFVLVDLSKADSAKIEPIPAVKGTMGLADVSQFWSGVYNFLSLIGEAVFRLLPVGIIWSITKKMGTTQILGIVPGLTFNVKWLFAAAFGLFYTPIVMTGLPGILSTKSQFWLSFLAAVVHSMRGTSFGTFGTSVRGLLLFGKCSQIESAPRREAPGGTALIIPGQELEIGLGMGAHRAHAEFTPSGFRMGTPQGLKESCGIAAALLRAPRREAPGGTALNNSWPGARNRPGDERTQGTRRGLPCPRGCGRSYGTSTCIRRRA